MNTARTRFEVIIQTNAGDDVAGHFTNYRDSAGYARRKLAEDRTITAAIVYDRMAHFYAVESTTWTLDSNGFYGAIETRRKCEAAQP